MSAYGSRHDRVRKTHGKASEHACESCVAAAQEWAQIHDTNGDSPDDYRPLCCSCHQKYDDHWSVETRAKLSATIRKMQDENPRMYDSLLGNENASGVRTPEQRARIGQAKLGNNYAAGKRTPEQRERIRQGRWGDAK